MGKPCCTAVTQWVFKCCLQRWGALNWGTDIVFFNRSWCDIKSLWSWLQFLSTDGFLKPLRELCIERTKEKMMSELHNVSRWIRTNSSRCPLKQREHISGVGSCLTHKLLYMSHISNTKSLSGTGPVWVWVITSSSPRPFLLEQCLLDTVSHDGSETLSCRRVWPSLSVLLSPALFGVSLWFCSKWLNKSGVFGCWNHHCSGRIWFLSVSTSLTAKPRLWLSS